MSLWSVTPPPSSKVAMAEQADRDSTAPPPFSLGAGAASGIQPTTWSAALQRICSLPTARPSPPALRPGRQLQTARTINAEAYVGQIAGTVAAMPCTHCKKGSGCWMECVVVAREFGGSCCNCHYGSEGIRCSFRPSVAPTPAVSIISASAGHRRSSRRPARTAPSPGPTPPPRPERSRRVGNRVAPVVVNTPGDRRAGNRVAPIVRDILRDSRAGNGVAPIVRNIPGDRRVGNRVAPVAINTPGDRRRAAGPVAARKARRPYLARARRTRRIAVLFRMIGEAFEDEAAACLAELWESDKEQNEIEDEIARREEEDEDEGEEEDEEDEDE